MKSLASCLLLFALACPLQAQNTTPTEAVPATEELAFPAFGSELPVQFGSLDWVTHEQIASFNHPDTLYLIDFWATWCGPCIAAMPHMIQLQERFADQGVQVVGISVFRDQEESVRDFLKEHPEINYPIALGSGTAFEEEVVRGAGVDSIPRIMAVREGKIIHLCHPAHLSEEVVEGLLDGSFDAQAWTDEQARQKAEATARKHTLEVAIGGGEPETIRAAASTYREANSYPPGLDEGALILADLIEGKTEAALVRVDAVLASEKLLATPVALQTTLRPVDPTNPLIEGYASYLDELEQRVIATRDSLSLDDPESPTAISDAGLNQNFTFVLRQLQKVRASLNSKKNSESGN